MTDADIAALAGRLRGLATGETWTTLTKAADALEVLQARAEKAEAYIAENADGLWMKRQVGYAMRAEKAEAEIERLRDVNHRRIDDLALNNNRLLEDIERLRDELEKIVQWSEAYPLDVFPEPDFKKARELLKAGGMTLDTISASAMRHVVEGVGRIAKDALSASN